MIEPTTAGEWKVRIDRPIWNIGLNFYILRYHGNWTEVVQPDGIMLRIAEGETTDHVKPTFTLSQIDGKQMMIALAEALETEGVKPPNDHKLQGLLEATKAHLSDLRQLLKLK